MTTKIINTLTGLVLLLAVAAPLHAGSILNHEMTVSVPFVARWRLLGASEPGTWQRRPAPGRAESTDTPHQPEGIHQHPTSRQACLQAIWCQLLSV